MIGITGCGYHVPFCRLERTHFGQAWNRRVGKGERAAIYFDEDALTLGFEAAQRCLEYTGNKKIDALFFASTSAPFWQRSTASFLAAACDLSAACETSDFGGSLRSATAALRAGVDALNSRRLSTLLIATGEVRDGQPGETEEEWFGDAGSAVTLGRENVLVEIMGLATHSSDFWDEWRRDGDDFIRTQASRFSTERGYQKNLVAVGKALLEKHGVQASQVAKVILPSPDGRAHSATAKKLGFQEAQLLDPCFGEIGAPGSAASFLLLAAALEGASPGDLLLLLNYGDGADGVLLRVTEEIQKRPLPSSLSDHLSEKRLYSSYQIFQKMRSYYKHHQEAAELSNVLLEKEESQNIRLHGTLCIRCGTRQYPITQVCGACQNRDSLHEVPLEHTGQIFTFTRDHLYVAPDSPTIMSVVDVDQGGRLYLQMTDVDPEDVRVEDPVVLTLRRRKEGPTMHNYYWKCRPVR
jgi:3-hydroxy-3-methylglutaryl CoA synthase